MIRINVVCYVNNSLQIMIDCFDIQIDQSLSVEEKVKSLTPVAGTKSPGIIAFYAYSKLCNILFAFALHQKVHKDGVDVFVLHPGAIKTGESVWVDPHTHEDRKLFFREQTSVFSTAEDKYVNLQPRKKFFPCYPMFVSKIYVEKIDTSIATSQIEMFERHLGGIFLIPVPCPPIY
jgi:short-subunit dehydrogenase